MREAVEQQRKQDRALFEEVFSIDLESINVVLKPGISSGADLRQRILIQRRLEVNVSRPDSASCSSRIQVDSSADELYAEKEICRICDRLTHGHMFFIQIVLVICVALKMQDQFIAGCIVCKL